MRRSHLAELKPLKKENYPFKNIGYKIVAELEPDKLILDFLKPKA